MNNVKTFRRSLSPTGPAVRALLDGPASLVADVAGGGISTEEEATTPMYSDSSAIFPNIIQKSALPQDAA